MKTQDIDRLLADACADQRDDLKRFAETGDQDALARIHFDECPDCDRAVEKIIELRDGLPPAPAILANAAWHRADTRWRMRVIVSVWIVFIGILGLGGYGLHAWLFSDTTARTEIGRLEERIRYMPMPGFPGTCVAAVQGTGGFGPTYFGAAPCAEIRARFDADEELTLGLRDYAVVRIRGTTTCLAHAPEYEHDFTFACAQDE